MSLGEYVKDLPRFDDVVRAVERVAKSSMAFDYITFSGNGEPTLHPRFAELVDEVVRIRDLHRSGVKTALLSNSTGLVYRSVRESIQKIDLPVFKLDAGTERKFKMMNRPAEEVDFTKILDWLASVGSIYLQTVLVEGTPSNVGKEELSAYFEHLSRIRPKGVHVYSIDRPVPNTKISLISPRRLEEIALRGHRETGVEIRAFHVG
jgi:wyosine [tRNA(Phe)-imidazoG37] synthetase (radical SAM superfamily)